MKAKRPVQGSNPDQDISEYAQTSPEEAEIPNVQLALQPDFYKIPRRFGSIPVDELPMGCDRDKQYYRLYPRIGLPFQRIERISFGHPKLDPNRLFWGDNLHVMRMLPSESIDLIYIDPPFFSGRNYNVIFGDQNEVRSFSDIWEGGMTGYLIWLNARLLEMKRLLKPRGSIFVHLDWHACHYVKVEMDKIFGIDNFVNEIIWYYYNKLHDSRKHLLPRAHDVIFRYSKNTGDQIHNPLKEKREQPTKKLKYHKVNGQIQNIIGKDGKAITYISEDRTIDDVWRIRCLQPANKQERIGYPTQKPEDFIERIITMGSNRGDTVADFFCGGGTTPTVAQKLSRRWIAADISKIAVAITQDRILGSIAAHSGNKTVQQSLSDTRDISIEYWGIYEIPSLLALSDDEFRRFILAAYDARVSSGEQEIHGYRNGVPIMVGRASMEARITKKEVVEFARYIATRKGKHHGIILAWAFAPSAQEAAEKLALQTSTTIDFVKVSLIPIESPSFKEWVMSKHKEYSNFLTFVLPPEIRLRISRVSPLTYEFDLSESVSLNVNGRIANVQWDFEYKERFVSTKGFSYIRGENNTPILRVKYTFPYEGRRTVGCKVQDDLGGEKLEIRPLEVR